MGPVADTSRVLINFRRCVRAARSPAATLAAVGTGDHRRSQDPTGALRSSARDHREHDVQPGENTREREESFIATGTALF